MDFNLVNVITIPAMGSFEIKIFKCKIELLILFFFLQNNNFKLLHCTLEYQFNSSVIKKILQHIQEPFPDQLALFALPSLP